MPLTISPLAPMEHPLVPLNGSIGANGANCPTEQTILTFSLVNVKSSGQVKGDCGIASEEVSDISGPTLLACEHSFLRSLDFSVSSISVTLDKDSSQCFSPSTFYYLSLIQEYNFLVL